MYRFKKLMAAVLSLAMLLVTVPTGMLSASAASTAEFQGGTGTEETPYLIATKAQLDNVRHHLDAHFKLVADIIFTQADFVEGGPFYHEGQGWDPIGTAESPFTGSFDGEGYAIQGLFINQAMDQISYTGLFGYTAGTIRNVVMTDSDLSNTSILYYAGGIAGYNTGSIFRCSFEGTLSGHIFGPGSVEYTDGYVGGIAGGSEGEIRACHSDGEISVRSSIGTSSAYGGGIVGLNTHIVSTCYNTASIQTALETVGGIVGKNDGFGAVNDCYNTGSVYADTSRPYASAGGIVGENVGSINRCYNFKAHILGKDKIQPRVC